MKWGKDVLAADAQRDLASSKAGALTTLLTVWLSNEKFK